MATAHGERTRRRILEAALPLFAEHGYAGTSTRMVAQAAGVNVATLAYHFEAKEGLYLTVVQRLHEELAVGFDPGAPPSNPSEMLEWWLRATWQFLTAHRQQLRLSMRHLLDQGQHPDVIVERWAGRLLSRGEAIIAPFRPEWSSQQRRLALLSFQHLMVRFVLEDRGQLAAMTGYPEDDVEEAVLRTLADLVRRTLGVPPY